MILGLEARMHILESAWSVWMQTYQFLVYQTDTLQSQKSLVLTSIHQNPGISSKQGQLKCYFCQVYGLLKCVYYYEYRTPISFWLYHYTEVILCHLAYLCLTAVVLSEKSWHAFSWNLLGRLLVLIQLLVIPKHLCSNIFHHQTIILQDCLSSSTADTFLMFSLLVDVSVRVMFKLSFSKPKNVIFCVGTNIYRLCWVYDRPQFL